ncbi:recombination mediator RecR [Actinomyces sp. oral taxon 181]|jgi:recombination protein recR|uniref:recombination mediator RecR n=1 Tax=Actinomyces sp. oral taxon 181 TaxID=712121 RepID=UPI0002A434A7|nr:recombination mediator RecR [Actinomyces sp. oral taxon 181]EKY14009.1 recombination protein RecR [Actinomyces sp. oral taxon 181 str. F0379]MBF0973563.1 recombination protein RecR [Actinomyces sp.]
MYEGALQDLIDELGQLPGVGPKSAQRMALHLLEAEPEDVERLTTAINAVRHQVKHCVVCGNLTEDDECSICRDPRRDPSVICVVQEPKDIQAIENSRVFRGRYHVLGGAIDPIHGIGPDQLSIRQLLGRLSDGVVQEIIIATNPNIEGEATASYLARTLSTIGVRTTRLAMGLPVGGDLEYADSITLGRAMEGRRNMS